MSLLIPCLIPSPPPVFQPSNYWIEDGSWTCDILLRNFDHYPCLAAIFVLNAKVRICMWEKSFPRTDTETFGGGRGERAKNGHCLEIFQSFCLFYFFFCNFLICLQLAGGMFVFDTLAQANTLAHANTPVQILLVVEAVYSVSLGIRSYLHSSSGKHFHCSIPRFIKYPLCECKCVCEREKGRGGKARWWT